MKEIYQNTYNKFISTVEVFVNYARENGSKNSKRYYKHFNTLLNEVIDIDVKCRNILSDLEYVQMIINMTRVTDFLIVLISVDKPYKEIYKLIKDALLDAKSNVA